MSDRQTDLEIGFISLIDHSLGYLATQYFSLQMNGGAVFSLFFQVEHFVGGGDRSGNRSIDCCRFDSARW